MSKYEESKPSGIDWIGNIPEHWNIKRLKEIANIETGNTPLTSNPNFYSEEGMPWIKPDNLNDFIEITASAEKLSENGIKEARVVRKGAVLVCCIGTIGKIGIAGCDLATNQQINSVEFYNKRILDNYGKYLLYISEAELIKQSNKVVVSILNKIKQSQIKFPIPSNVEQLNIANYLDNQTQKIDRLIATKKAQAEKLKELRQIEINNAVTKGLNPNAELKDSGIDWLGEIPKHWETNRLKNVTYINQEVLTEKTSPDYEIKYIDIGNVTSNGEFLELQEMNFSEAPSRARRKPKHNSIILSTVRTYLRAIAIVQNPDEYLIASTGFAVIDAYVKLFDAKYLFYQMTSHIVVERVIANSEGVSYPAISSTKLGDMKIILPPKEEQELISKYLDTRTTSIDKLIKNIEAQIEKQQELRKIKIYEAVTGKIKVNAYVEATA